MKFLDGKTPAERNKIIIAIILGGVALIALSYTLSGFFFPPATAKAGTQKTPTPSPSAGNQNQSVAANPNDPTSMADLAWMLTTPVSYSPNAFSGDAGRNIFAFYEPPPPTPWVQPAIPVPVVTPPPTPVPPPQLLAYVTPSSVYAGSKGFRLEAIGDKFTADTRILFNGSELPTNFVSTQKLTADIPAGLISSDGSKQIMVRTPDGKLYSNPLMLQAQAPPRPNFTFVGLVEKKQRNNDLAILQEKNKSEVSSYRLNDSVGDRFRLVSISSREVILEDRSLGFRYPLPFSEKSAGGSSSGGNTVTNGGGFGRGNPGNGLPTYIPYNPSGGPNPVNPPSGDIPGIPANIQRYVPPTVINNNSNKGQQKKDYEDDDEDGDNR